MRIRLILGVVVIIFLVIVGVIFVNIIGNNFKASSSTQLKSTVTIDGHTFHVQVANTQQKQEQGLSDTSSLPKDQGMLFVFPTPDYYAFWMRNMNYPLDIVYIGNNKIVSIAHNVAKPSNPATPLPVYKPSSPATMVLEINGGLSDVYHFSLNDTVHTSL